MSTELADVAASTPDAGMLASTALADSSTAPETLSGESQASVTAPDAQTTGQQQSQVPPDPLADLPTLEELKQQAEQKLPGAQGMLNLRTAYETYKAETEPLKALQPWQEVAKQFTDPQEVLAQRELISKIHTPDPNSPTGYTPLPFLQELETQSPGSSDALFSTLLTMSVPSVNGGQDTLVRELYRAHGLDPDRIEDYRNIDQRAPQSGLVTTDQLVGIDPKFHEAFRALSPAQRDDILAQKTTDEQGRQVLTAAATDYLNDKLEALETRKWREQDQQAKTQAQQAQQAQWEQETEKAVNEDISGLRRSMYESIHQGLASQWKPTSDEGQNAVEYAKVMGTLACLLDPDLRWTAEAGLKAAGVTLDPKFDELVQAFAGGRAEYTRQSRMGDQMRAKMALNGANLAQQQLLVKLNQYSLALAKPSAERLQAQSQGLVNSLNGAAARVIPSGSTVQQSGNENPFKLPPGVQPMSPEADAHFANVTRQMQAAR